MWYKCNLWTHIKCKKTKNQTYFYLQTNTYWYCMPCIKEFLPFSGTSDEEFVWTTIDKQIKFIHIGSIRKSVRENFIQKITRKPNTSKYFNMSDLQSLNIYKNNDFALFRMNINSLQFYFDEFKAILVDCPKNSQILGIT